MFASMTAIVQTPSQRFFAGTFMLAAVVNLTAALASAWPTLKNSIAIGLAFFVSKALLMPLLAAFLTLRTRGKRSDLPLPSILLALLFCWMGDIALALADILRLPDGDARRKLFFMGGVCAFGMAHLFYIYTFLRYLSLKQFDFRLALLYALPFAVYSYTMYSVLYQHLTGGNEALRLPLAIYMVVLISDGLSSFLRKFQIDAKSSSSILTGVVLFVQSDSIIAITEFVDPLPLESFTIMATYILGQWLIVNGCILRVQEVASDLPASQPTVLRTA
jgi:uncharacterized membrane protein YhhN